MTPCEQALGNSGGKNLQQNQVQGDVAIHHNRLGLMLRRREHRDTGQKANYRKESQSLIIANNIIKWRIDTQRVKRDKESPPAA